MDFSSPSKPSFIAISSFSSLTRLAYEMHTPQTHLAPLFPSSGLMIQGSRSLVFHGHAQKLAESETNSTLNSLTTHGQDWPLQKKMSTRVSRPQRRTDCECWPRLAVHSLIVSHVQPSDISQHVAQHIISEHLPTPFCHRRVFPIQPGTLTRLCSESGTRAKE